MFPASSLQAHGGAPAVTDDMDSGMYSGLGEQDENAGALVGPEMRLGGSVRSSFQIESDGASMIESDNVGIRVVIRIRPMNKQETTRNDIHAVEALSDCQTIRVTTESIAKPLTFHAVMDGSVSQEQMFNECGVIPLLQQALDGYAVTVFAYGQTGSGKTFTMTGPSDSSAATTRETGLGTDAGVIQRSLNFLFEEIRRRPERRYTVKASYLEIYNEQIRDLLNPGGANLPVRWTNSRGFYVENIFIVECEKFDDCMAVLEEGLRNRTTASHKLNERSSRSHSILTVAVDFEFMDDSEGFSLNFRKMGKISFVDLAGSEKVKESKASGDTLTETNNINKSLLTLGNCISALAEKKKGSFVPYRDSKLTKLLSHSLGGSGLTLMIACVTPSSFNVQESLKTLRYANRAKKIKNKPVIQMDANELLIMNLKNELKFVKSENAHLRYILGLEGGQPLPSGFGMIQQAPPPAPSRQENTGFFPPIQGSSSSGNAVRNEEPNKYRMDRLSLELEESRKLLNEFIRDNEKLKLENVELHNINVRSQVEFGQLMHENEVLVSKLERLEKVFVDSGFDISPENITFLDKRSIDRSYVHMDSNKGDSTEKISTMTEEMNLDLAESLPIAKIERHNASVANSAETTNGESSQKKTITAAPKAKAKSASGILKDGSNQAKSGVAVGKKPPSYSLSGNNQQPLKGSKTTGNSSPISTAKFAPKSKGGFLGSAASAFGTRSNKVSEEGSDGNHAHLSDATAAGAEDILLTNHLLRKELAELADAIEHEQSLG